MFDSLSPTVTNRLRQLVVHSLYQCDTENIIMSKCKKQSGGKDCGLFAITFTVALVFNNQPSKLKFNQQQMRCHLVECFTKQQMTTFPCIHKYGNICCDL